MRAQKTQGQLLRALVATASNAENQDRQIGRTLFKLLVPLEMEAVLAGTGEMQIELEPETAGIPWELLDTDEGDERTGRTKPWAIRTKLLRKLRIQDYRVQVTDASIEASILVIGEPACPKDFPRLFAAREEAVAVYQCLAGPNGLGETNVKGLFSDDSTKVRAGRTKGDQRVARTPLADRAHRGARRFAGGWKNWWSGAFQWRVSRSQ